VSNAVKYLIVGAGLGGLIFAGCWLFTVFEGVQPNSDPEFPQVCTTIQSEIHCKPDCNHIPKETIESLMSDGTDRASAVRVLKLHKMYWRDACPGQTRS
jgi:hypothetical protein